MPDDRVNNLINALDDPSSREEAVRTLGTLGDRRAVVPLGRVLLAPDGGGAMAYRVRQMAAEALAKLGDPDGVPFLIDALEDRNGRVRLTTTEALGEIGDARAVPALVDVLADDNAEVRAAAVKALGDIRVEDDTVPAAMVALLADPEDAVRDATASAFTTLGQIATAALMEALKHANSTVRGAAADLLGDLGDEATAETLRDVAFGDSSNWVRSRAQTALKKILPDHYQGPLVRREVNLTPPPDTIELIRRQGPEWPSLQPAKRASSPTDADKFTTGAMTVDEIKRILDQIDIRLANGEITEATYNRLVERWESRLRQLKD